MQWTWSTKKVLAVVTLVVLIGLGYRIWFGASSSHVPQYSTSQVIRGDIGRMLRLSGTIKPLSAWRVISPISAKIKNVFVKEGELVTKGQLLIQFDGDDLTAKLASARAAYLKAQNRFKEVENWQASPAYVDIKANLEINQVELEAKEKEYEQNKQLHQAKAISKQDLERSKLELDRSRAELAKSKAQLVETEAKNGSQALQEAQAELTVVTLALSEARENLANKEVRAPITGIVNFARPGGESSKAMSTAETSLTPKISVSSGQVLLIIQSHNQLAAEVYVNEYDVHRVRPGMPCMITLPALPEVILPGKIDSVSAEISDKLTAFKVRCQILQADSQQTVPSSQKNRGKNLAAETTAKEEEGGGEEAGSHIIVGMTANVAIPLEAKTDVLLVPISALVRRDNTSGVYVLEKSGVPVFTKVKVGIISQNDAEILEGVEEGQEILEEVPGKLLDKPSLAGGE